MKIIIKCPCKALFLLGFDINKNGQPKDQTREWKSLPNMPTRKMSTISDQTKFRHSIFFFSFSKPLLLRVFGELQCFQEQK